MYCPAFRNAKVKVATADRSTDMLFCAKKTPPDCSSILPQGLKYVAVRLLNGETYYFVVDINNKAVQLFYQVCCMLKIGKTELFGLAILSDGVYNYVDQDLKISKYAPKSWKTQSGNGVDIKGNILTFYFRVEIYVDCHILINDKIARHHYYLQLKENLMIYSQPLNEERIFLLAAYALQADFGNFNPKIHTGKYFEPYKYFPPSIISKVGEAYIIQHAPAMHEDNTGLSCGEAEISYIREASNHISPLNLHFYKMNTKKSKESSSVWVGISPVGIEIYKEEVQKLKNQISSFPWADVSKLFFDKRKFEIRSCGCPEDRKFTYYANSEEAAKNLLRLSKENHLYYLATRTQVQAFKKVEQEGRKKFRESYIYSDISELDREHTQRDSGVVPDKTTREDHLEDVSHKILKQYHTKAKNIINSRSQSVRVGAYESFMQSDSGHSSFAENRSSSASPEAVTPSWQEKSQQNSTFIDEMEGDINLSSIPFPSNQVVSPDVGNIESSFSQKSAGAKSFFTDLLSKSKNNIEEPTNSQATESSQNQKSFRDCNVETYDSNQQYIVNNNNVLNYSDYSKDQIISVSHQPVSSFALCGRTRIGISSLCHQPHKNTLGILQRNEEKPQCIDIEYKPLFKTKQNLSSDSGVSSPSNGTLNGKSEQCSVCFSHLESKERLMSTYDNREIPDILSSKTDDNAFPCIPPPPGYENSSEFHSNKVEKDIGDQLDFKSLSSKLNAEPPCKSTASPVMNPVIDLQLLRQKSQDMGLPLISGLCNDRSLLMLPKTVPTCSRNRHLGVTSNPRRFSCSSVNPLCTSETVDYYLSGKAACVRLRSHTTSPEIRPTTWHVDSNFPWENKQVQKDTNKPPWRNYNDSDSRNKQSSTQEMYSKSLPPPPSILTSFPNVVSGHASQQNICTTASRQMIPTKLSSAFCNAGNTRLPAK